MKISEILDKRGIKIGLNASTKEDERANRNVRKNGNNSIGRSRAKHGLSRFD